ncbi:MAG TPA: hypothetical protein VFS21_11620 [Roseiflexaceae bacterium]|nr:hypothetical protein [Roseiflexaceae bacterium]
MIEGTLQTLGRVRRRPTEVALRRQGDLAAVCVLLLLALAATVLAYRFAPVSRLDVGTTYAEPYLGRFYAPEENPLFNYAFSTDGSEVTLPGAGAGQQRLRLRLSGYRGPGVAPPTLTLHSEGRLVASIPLREQPAVFQIVAQSSGDLSLRWNSSTFSPSQDDPRRLGVAVDWIEVTPLDGLPAPGQLLYLGLIAPLAYLLLRRLRLRLLPSAVLAAAATLTLAVLLATERMWWANYIPLLLGLLIGLHLALWPLQALTRWLWRAGGAALSERNNVLLWRIITLAALIKIGGVIHPQIIVFDERWHVPRTMMVLDGHVRDLLVPSRVTLLGETVGLEGGHFPYSPMWYFITAPFDALGLDLGIASNALNAAIDVSRSLLIALIALRLFGSQRAALWAAGIYHLLPMPYYLLSWGNWPTQLGLWGGLALIAAVAATFEHPPERRMLALLTGAGLLAMMTYTVLGIVSFTMVGLLAILEWLRRRDPLAPVRARTLLGALVLAELAAFALYHVWYVPTLLAQTLPAIAGAVTAPDRELHGQPKPGLLGDLQVNGSYALNHLTWLVIGLLPPGLVLAWRRTGAGGRLLIAAWLLTLALFALFSWAVADMIFKHIFFTLPLVAMLCGLVLSALWKRPGWASRAVPAALLLFLAAFCAERWYFYIMIKRH